MSQLQNLKLHNPSAPSIIRSTSLQSLKLHSCSIWSFTVAVQNVPAAEFEALQLQNLKLHNSSAPSAIRSATSLTVVQTLNHVRNHTHPYTWRTNLWRVDCQNFVSFTEIRLRTETLGSGNQPSDDMGAAFSTDWAHTFEPPQTNRSSLSQRLYGQSKHGPCLSLQVRNALGFSLTSSSLPNNVQQQTRFASSYIKDVFKTLFRPTMT